MNPENYILAIGCKLQCLRKEKTKEIYQVGELYRVQDSFLHKCLVEKRKEKIEIMTENYSYLDTEFKSYIPT